MDSVNLTRHFYKQPLFQGCARYRPQTKLREGYVFTGVCDSVNRGACMVPRGHAWLWGGDVHGCLGGMHGCRGVCVDEQ